MKVYLLRSESLGVQDSEVEHHVALLQVDLAYLIVAFDEANGRQAVVGPGGQQDALVDHVEQQEKLD